jgi:acetamidase/formamidase
MSTHHVPGPVHRLWTTKHEPVLTIGSGDTITFEVQEGGGGQFDDFNNGDPVPAFDFDAVYPLVGPIMVDGAEPGDTIELEVLDYQPDAWGWTAVIPGMGLLSEDFTEAVLHRWDLTTSGGADFKGIATIPLRPFCGVMACTPDVVEPQNVIPPGHFGGNMDCRDLTVGSRVFLPVQTSGARIAFGDPHAAQGDGEVCVAALEAGLSGSMRVRLHKGMTIAAPRFQTAGPLRSGIDGQGYFATMGIGPDLMIAAQDAVRGMIDHLGKEYGVDPLDAYLLSSVAVDLKITEVVDLPNWVVSAYLPLSIMK